MDQIKKIISYNGVFPELEEDTFVAENSRLIGNVYLGKYSSIWFNCTLRGDVNHIRIGKKTNIQDGTVIHVSSSVLNSVAIVVAVLLVASASSSAPNLHVSRNELKQIGY